MKSEALATPPAMLMGFHYTPQYCRRNRIVVMSLVDQSTDAWERWYRQMHEPAAITAMAEAGYGLIEIHFMYGYGLTHEADDIALTTQFVQHAHQAGMKVIGYFQFFSVNQETFFLEHPWAKACLQRQADGTPHSYRYDRPALCFSHEQVQRYYLEGIEAGLTLCDLDGIRLDNDYYLGCYCDTCQEAFRAWLADTFDPAETRRTFGLSTTAGMSLVPSGRQGDPLLLASVRFRQHQRQEMMQLLHAHVQQVKPGAILGGNPVISRRPNDVSRVHVYPPDLGDTHHLVCAENSLFPGRQGDGIRSQIVAYKHGQANEFRVFASHHLHTPEGALRWPESSGECALSLCEALAFGGHVPCTTWGLRMDGDELGALYQRPVFMNALRPIAAFVKQHADLYREAVCSARVGIYVNRESLSGDAPRASAALYGTVEALMTHQIPFRFIDRDDQPLDELQLLIVPAMRFVSDTQVGRFREFAADRHLLLLGDACRADEWMLGRDDYGSLRVLAQHLDLTPTELGPDETYHHLPRLPEAAAIANLVRRHAPPVFELEATPFITVETARLPDGRVCLHLLNYDREPATVTLRGDAQVLSPQGFGPARIESRENTCTLHDLRTYAVVIPKDPISQ